jgi:hypothetical protein
MGHPQIPANDDPDELGRAAVDEFKVIAELRRPPKSGGSASSSRPNSVRPPVREQRCVTNRLGRESQAELARSDEHQQRGAHPPPSTDGDSDDEYVGLVEPRDGFHTGS